jgi:hypothetical protein
VKLNVVRRRATTYGNREKGERGSELQPGAWSQAARRRTGRDHDNGWKWHGGATLGSGAPAAKLRHGGTMASKGEHGGCSTPVLARHLATKSPTGGPHASVIFKFQKNSKIAFRSKKNRYKVRKNMGKFMKVGNPIWNTFYDYNFLRFSMNFELF